MDFPNSVISFFLFCLSMDIPLTRQQIAEKEQAEDYHFQPTRPETYPLLFTAGLLSKDFVNLNF